MSAALAANAYGSNNVWPFVNVNVAANGARLNILNVA